MVAIVIIARQATRGTRHATQAHNPRREAAGAQAQHAGSQRARIHVGAAPQGQTKGGGRVGVFCGWGCGSTATFSRGASAAVLWRDWGVLHH